MLTFLPEGHQRTRLGFVGFWSRGDGSKSILMLNNVTVQGKKISVCEHKEAPESIRFWRKRSRSKGIRIRFQVVRGNPTRSF